MQPYFAKQKDKKRARQRHTLHTRNTDLGTHRVRVSTDHIILTKQKCMQVSAKGAGK